MRRRNFKSSQWIWHLLAVVQAANIAMWFHSLLKESYDRFRLNEEIGHSFDAYFDFCRNTTSYYEIDPHVCTKKSSVAKWFVFSAPILFPITIEFNLLVIETLLDRSIGAESHNFVENAEQNDSDQEVNTVADDAHEPTDRRHYYVKMNAQTAKPTRSAHRCLLQYSLSSTWSTWCFRL